MCICLENEDSKITLALGIISCLLGGRKCIYVSTPITNGRRLIEWRRHTNSRVFGHEAERRQNFYENVVTPNCEDGKAFANKVRASTPDIVIDPSCLHLDDWSQDDYLSLWSRIIEHFAAEVRFNDGWEYSNGCAHEYVVAGRSNIPVKNCTGDVISIDEAVNSVSSAIPLLREVGVSTGPIEATLSEIVSLKNLL